MISTFLLIIISTFLGLLVNLVPSLPAFPQSWVDAINLVWGYINVFSFIAPVGTLVTVLGLALAFHGIIFLVHLLSWVMKKLPFVN